jgi:CheY-like chemotaxis protein
MGEAIASTPTGEALVRRRVLVVDDDSDVRSCLLEFLSRAGIAAGGALDGRDALEQVQSDLPTRAHIPKPFAFAQLLEIVFRECRRCALCDGDGPVVGSIFDARVLVDRAVR